MNLKRWADRIKYLYIAIMQTNAQYFETYAMGVTYLFLPMGNVKIIVY